MQSTRNVPGSSERTCRPPPCEAPARTASLPRMHRPSPRKASRLFGRWGGHQAWPLGRPSLLPVWPPRAQPTDQQSLEDEAQPTPVPCAQRAVSDQLSAWRRPRVPCGRRAVAFSKLRGLRADVVSSARCSAVSCGVRSLPRWECGRPQRSLREMWHHRGPGLAFQHQGKGRGDPALWATVRVTVHLRI